MLRIIRYMLHAVGFLPSVRGQAGKDSPVEGEMEKILLEVYEKMGDALALQYGRRPCERALCSPQASSAHHMPHSAHRCPPLPLCSPRLGLSSLCV